MDLGDWRSRINDLDNQILHLLNQRAEAARQIGDLKRRQDAPHYVPEREAEILQRLTDQNPGPLPSATVRAIWTEILSGCRRLESPLTVSHLGPLGTFTHQAALARFGSAVTYRATRTIAEVFDDVERGRVDYGVVPVENTTEGAVNITLDRLVESNAVICGEMTLEVAQQLLSHARELASVKKVLSHPQGIAQCRAWLAANLPDVPTEEVASTAGAVEMAASDPTLAGIASALAGEIYGVPILCARIEDNQHNSTRFLVIGLRPTGPTGRDKTSFLFAMRNEPGSLYRILEPCARLGINLTKVESRPARWRSWEYLMFVDIEGHREDAPVATALAEIGERTVFLKVLGSYPAA